MNITLYILLLILALYAVYSTRHILWDSYLDNYGFTRIRERSSTCGMYTHSSQCLLKHICIALILGSSMPKYAYCGKYVYKTDGHTFTLRQAVKRIKFIKKCEEFHLKAPPPTPNKVDKDFMKEVEEILNL